MKAANGGGGRGQVVVREVDGIEGAVRAVLGQIAANGWDPGVMFEQNIPETGRWLVIPAWLAAMIKKSELRDVSLSGDGASMLRNGRLGMIDRFTLYMSNLLPSGTGGGLAAGPPRRSLRRRSRTSAGTP